MGGRQSKEEIKAKKLIKERNEAITRQRYYELNEMRQDWRFVFGEHDPKQNKEVYTITDVTPRAMWMEDMYIFKQIVAARPEELFHDQSEYALKWIPPGCNFMVMIPFDNPIMMESAIISVNQVLPQHRIRLLFHFAPKNSNQTMFRQHVHPASLVSYHHRPEVLNKLCVQFLEDRMGIEEFRQTVGSHYEVWKRAMYNMLPEDEQVYHTYLTEVPEEIGGPARNFENEYLNGYITLQEYHDLKYPERKKRKDAEREKYPLPYGTGHCIICSNDETGIIKCNTCDNHVCIACVNEKFHDEETKAGSYLLIHRLFCLRMAPLRKIQLAHKEAPGYLRELRQTGQAAAQEMIEKAMKDAENNVAEEESEEESEDEEEKRYNEEMRLLREQKEHEKMMRENPPALQHLTKIFDNKVKKKAHKLKKECMEHQVRIDEPGHTDQFYVRLQRLKDESVESTYCYLTPRLDYLTYYLLVCLPSCLSTFFLTSTLTSLPSHRYHYRVQGGSAAPRYHHPGQGEGTRAHREHHLWRADSSLRGHCQRERLHGENGFVCQLRRLIYRKICWTACGGGGSETRENTRGSGLGCGARGQAARKGRA
jgi:hypothetical protein